MFKEARRVCETIKGYKKRAFSCGQKINKYLCNYIVRQYFKGTYDVISVTMARRKVHKQTLIFSIIVNYLKN